MSALVNRPTPARPTPFPEATHLSKPNHIMLELLAAQQITSFVIDAEVVALDKDTAAFRTFQDLSNRAKKDVKVEDIKVIVGVFSFDLMLLNDEVSIGGFGGDQLLSS
jgi:DNA ligase-1